MAKRKPTQTLADYVAIAISPALIMLLVGSLAFFLLDVMYHGDHAGRFRWVLGWFVFAAVLISRIAIEQGSEQAFVYTAAFWIAILLVVMRFLDNPLVGVALLGIVWWCTKQLTYDCTLIDDSQDASGEGLLQVAGIDESSTDTSSDEEITERNDDSPKRPHSPGLWVVYFSLAALPIFGIGQAFIPRSDESTRDGAFRLLWVYVAAGIGLLLTTSFLGLRRYLRQRRLTMPKSVTATWLSMGVGLALAVLILTVLLPRPNAAYSISNVVDEVSERIGQASDYAMNSDDAGEGEGRAAGKEDESAKDGSRGSEGEQPSEHGESEKPQGGDGEKDGQGENNGNGQNSSPNGDGEEEDKKAEESNQSNSQGSPKDDEGEAENDSASESSPTPGQELGQSIQETVTKLAKIVIYGILAVVVIVLLVRYWEFVVNAIRKFLADLASLFGGRSEQKPSAATLQSETEYRPPPKPFASFRNPFHSGMASSMPPEELLRYTFAALEAWGNECGVPRPTEMTALEYAAQLGQAEPEIASPARELARLYTQAAYSSRPLPNDVTSRVEKIWASLERTPTTA
ncbi:DUF4129 domain-containing protein [Thalassoroseus pseudoceratinae]|uniref:DUF4129 domain-containing protein n=1 Tax=Thalassoroseus pseudoceratinae TaxID=2713176 RepID=UPI00141FCC34|nr:DUF4129 domain-containing protein [Thalassoroseus pseudoceratinae]